MDGQATAQIPRPFLEMPDPRAANRRHKLIDIITIALFGVLCGADGWVAVAAYGRAKLAWLKTFLELPFGIPSHDTFNDVFAKLDPDAFESRFQQWIGQLVQLTGGKLVAIDGKSLRRSFEHAWDKSGMAILHHLGTIPVESQAAGRQPQPAGNPGRGASRTGVAQRTAGVRQVRLPPAGLV